MFYFIPVLLILLTAYVGWHLWMLPPVVHGLRWCLVALVALCVGMAIFSLTRYLDRVPMWMARVAYNVGNKGLIVLLYLLMLFLVVDLLRLVHVVPTAWERDNWWACGVLLVAMGAVFVYGSVHYHHKERVALSLDGHGKGVGTARLVCLSDLHLGYHNGRKELSRWVDLINAEHPDAVLLAGDLVDRSLRPLLEEDMAAELRRLEAPAYACLGNHEYYADRYTPGEVEQFYRDAGITLLRDSVATVGKVVVMGRDDRTNARRRSVQQLKEKFHVPQTSYLILLDHQPYHLEEAEQAGVDFQFSGHTHRGQVWPLSWVTDALYECSWGSLRKGTTDYYVSSGLGIWGAKYRIGTQSEYVVVDIH
ncbi:MAG: metallophosphoesterase [Bacteroidales bacterium]|nr:metallophosphoesterase [Bacteroidales bacterium]